MIKQEALVKLAQVRLAINYVLRQRMEKQAGSLRRLGYDAAKFYGGAGYAGFVDLDEKHNVVANTQNLMRTPTVRTLWNRGVLRALSAPWDKARQEWDSNYNKAYNQAFPMEDDLDAINNPELDRRQRDWHNNYIKQHPQPPVSPYDKLWIQ